ncbi:MAG: DegT/DnrJ/EryC1/StrS family aminotransferase [Dehalococcoidia bacterium]
MIPVFRPSFDDEEWYALREPLQAGWVALGPKTKEFEQRFAEYIGVPHAVALNSATAALHLAMKILDVEGGEVITTPLTFVSTNHAILYNGGTPVFADLEEDTLNIDPAQIERLITTKTKAIMLVHYGGHACDVDRIKEIIGDRDIKIIEDAAHAAGGEYKGRKVGTLGDAACFSFQAVKNMTTGDGGMLTVWDEDFDRRVRELRWLGLSSDTASRSATDGKYSWYYEAVEVGFKCHMNDIAAAIGLVQLRKLDRMNERRRELAAQYDRAFAAADWIQTPVEKEYTRSARHNYVIKVDNRDDLIAFLREREISTGVHYVPNHFYQMYRGCKADVPVTERVWRKLVTLPLFPDLTGDQMEHIIGSVLEFGKTGVTASTKQQD